MASVTKLKSGKWRARYRTPDNHSRSKTFDRKVDAERFLTSVEHNKLSGSYIDPSAGKITFESYAREWQRIQVQHRPSTVAQIETNLTRHVFPHFGSRPLGSIRPTEIQTWVAARSEHLAPGTVELVYRYVVAIFRAAVRDRLLQYSPCVEIKLPRIEKQVVIPLETSHVQALVEAVPARFRALVLLAASTGMRQGECFGLTVDRVNFPRRQVKVDRQIVLPKGSAPTFGPPKTNASHRTIPLPDIAVHALNAHLQEFKVGVDGLLFTNEKGEAIRRTRFSDFWRPAVAAAGLPVGTRFHDLRHYYASLLIRHGESVKVVQSRLGHASAAETLDTYSHLWPDSEDTTRAAVDRVLRFRDDGLLAQ